MPAPQSKTPVREEVQPTKAATLFALGLSLAAAALRLAGLPRQGITNYDEAVHLLEARFLRAGWTRNLMGRHVPLAGIPLMHAKPLHSALIALAQDLLGDHPWTGAVVAALFGAAAVLLVFDFGRRIWGEEEGIVAAALLAALPWSVLYGRMALPEADSTFFVLLAVTTQAGRSRALTRSLAAGAIAGLAFLANYRWGVLLVLLFAGVEWAWLTREARSALRRAVEVLVGIVGFLLPAAFLVFLADFIYRRAVLGSLLAGAVRPRTYLEDLAHNFGKFEAMGIGIRDPLRLPYFLWVFGGPVLLLGLAAALFFSIRRSRATAPSAAVDTPARQGTTSETRGTRRGSSSETLVRQAASRRAGLAAVSLLAALPVILFLGTPCIFPRCLSAALPAWCLLAGWGLTRLLRSPRFVPGLAILVFALQLPLGERIWLQRSGYGDAARWLEDQGIRRCVATQAYVFQVYGINAVGAPGSLSELPNYERQGYRYLVLDNQAWIGPQVETCRALRGRESPIVTIPHPSGGDAAFLWEAPESSLRQGFARAGGPDWLRPSQILIFDLKGLTE